MHVEPEADRSGRHPLRGIRRRLASLHSEVRHGAVGPALISGALVAVMTSVIGVSFAALIFGGELADWIPYAISLSLLSAVVLGGLSALLSSFPGTITIPQDRLAPILALMAAAITARLHGTVPPDEIARTVLAAIAVASLLLGLAFYLLGKFGLGDLIRFIPYPVVGGFLAGSGWLLVAGSFQVMTGSALNRANLLPLLHAGAVAHWLPGLLLGAGLWAVMRWRPHVLAIPAALLGTIGLFHAAAAVAGASPDRLRAAGWLLRNVSAVPVSRLRGLLDLHALSGVHWGAVAAEGGFLAAIVLTGVVSILLNTTAIEVVADRDIDLNRELKVAGAANLLGGLGGCLPGFVALSLTRLPLTLGGAGRLTGLVHAALCAAVLLGGSAFLGYVPKFVLGGLLLYMGIGFLVEWVVDGARRLPRADYAVMLLILAVVGTFGYLQGVAVGIAAASTLFVVGYSQVSVIARRLTGAEQHSNVDRSEGDARLLQERGGALLVLNLQGYLFFGSAHTLHRTLKARIADAGQPPLRFVLLDFGRVTGLDSSALLSLDKMRRLGARHGFRLALVRVPEPLERRLRTGGLDAPDVRYFPDRDYGLEWGEDELLRAAGPQGEAETLVHYLEAHWPPASDRSRLSRYLERALVPTDGVLLRQGDPARELYFLESGSLRVELETGHGRVVRLRSLRRGTVVGELGFYLDAPRSATVRAEVDCVVHRLTRDSLKRMEADDPAGALLFHHYMSRLLADRLAHTNRSLEAALE